MDANSGSAKNPYPVVNAEQIPARRYHDADFYELERKHVWPHTWQMACRLELIPEVGDYIEYRIFEKSVIVVRTKSGIKAFHNSCRHRGVKLASGSGNCKVKGFICPFHGWRWNMDGENTFVFGKQIFSAENLEAAELNLVPCRVELWGGCAFINFDNDAPALKEHLGSAAERLDMRNVDQLQAEWWYATVLPTNWKTAMEAFMESYHVMRTHPELHATMGGDAYGPDAGRTPAAGITGRQFVERFIDFCEVLRDGMAGQISARELAVVQSLRDLEVPDDVPGAAGVFLHKLREEITAQGRAEGIPVADLNEVNEREPRILVEFMFPHFFMLPIFGVMASYRIRPLSPETCLFEIWSLNFYREGEHQPPREPTVLPYDSKEFPLIPQQDYSNLPLQQEGLHAEGFEYMRLSHQVEGMISNYQRLIDGYIAGQPIDRLAAGNRVVNQGYDSPVSDLGF